MKYLFRNRLMAAACDAECAVTLPPYGAGVNNCVYERLPGGFVQAITSTCDLDWTSVNIQDQTFWQAAFDDGKLVPTGRIKGSGFAVTNTTESTDACRPDEITGRTWSSTIKDYNVDLTDGADVTYWDAILQSINAFQLAMRSQTNHVWGFFALSADVKPTMPDNCDNMFFREVVFSWKSLSEPKRYYLPWLSSVLPI